MLLKDINEQHVTHFPQMNPRESGSYSPSLKMAIAKNCKRSRNSLLFYHVSCLGAGIYVWEGKAEMLNV